jgi:hypothetical protein
LNGELKFNLHVYGFQGYQRLLPPQIPPKR